jgi:hypothetical protein
MIVSVKNSSTQMLGILTVVLLFTSSIHAFPYEVLVIDIAGGSDTEKIREFEKDARHFNELHLKGYPAAKPFFDVVQMANRQVYFVFGFRGQIQGINRYNYPGTQKNLRRMRRNGDRKYPNLKWVSVEAIRQLLPNPEKPEPNKLK